ncbi:MAG: molecular chaperone HtpG [Candidatus Egerieousia sp.]
MTAGKIGVTTENIFPVIKKFLYSDHEIFLRELVANAVDATKKLKAIAGKGEFKGELGDLTVKVESSEKDNTLTITDRGIGMTAEEVDKYINQIAFSSAGEFLEKYKDQLDSIIGHFGLGFYSAFMVSKKVEIETLSYKEGSKGVKWSCDGSPEYTMEECDRSERGTKITLYLDDESKEFATKSKVEELLGKYCKFMPVKIAFGKETEWKDGKSVETDKDKIINNIEPLWAKNPSEIKDEDYLEFYRNLYPMKEDPLFWIHLNVDYPFNLTGILYFPKIKDRMDVSKNRIQLYCNQMFVTDSVENIVPDFLTLLYGVIDSPDIPLNVSRSYLQADSNVKKISTYITRKVADRLESISKENKKEFEEKWDNLKLFIEYGMLTDEKFCERAMKFALFKTTDDKFIGYDEYRKLIEAEQTDKDKKVVYLYATDKTAQYQYIEKAKNKGYQVLVFDSQLDSHFVNLLETKIADSRFARVDSDSIDSLIPKKEIEKPALKAGEQVDFENAFTAVLPTDANYNLVVENLGENNEPVLITQNEFMRRYKEMSALGGGLNFYGEMPDSYTIRLNWQNPIVQNIAKAKDAETSSQIEKLAAEKAETENALDTLKKETEGKKPEEISTEQKDKKEELNKKLSEIQEQRKEVMTKFAQGNTLLKQVADIALLSNNMLKGKALSDFIARSLDLLK